MAKQLDAIDLVLKPSIRCSKARDFFTKGLNSGGPSRVSLGPNPEILSGLSPRWRRLDTCANKNEMRTLDLSGLVLRNDFFPRISIQHFPPPPVQIGPPAGLFHPLGVTRELLESNLTFSAFDAVKMIVPFAYAGM